MSRSRILSSLAAAAIGVGLLGACSAESLTERAVSIGLEQAVEGDQDIDLDLGGDGGFSISTDEGEFSVDFDEENGSIVFNTDDGDGVISFDEDNGTINFETDEGDGQISFDEEDGTVTIDTEDGQVGLVSGPEIPEGWPTFIGMPTTLIPGSQNFSVVELPGLGTSISATFGHAEGDPFAQHLAAALQADGWTGSATPTSDGGLVAMLQKDGARIQIVADPNNLMVSHMEPVG